MYAQESDFIMLFCSCEYHRKIIAVNRSDCIPAWGLSRTLVKVPLHSPPWGYLMGWDNTVISPLLVLLSPGLCGKGDACLAGLAHLRPDPLPQFWSVLLQKAYLAAGLTGLQP
ncbi:hypothetical protein GOODEAATRI_010327 [Goodea atripinnis]|uniref:Uncharacterized protein n=1 Tax=Goodea atripinnis TaxID=208336 RepID=A0ABV0N9H3_9TELE